MRLAENHTDIQFLLQVEQSLLLVTSWYRIPPDWSIPIHPHIRNDIERMSI